MSGDPVVQARTNGKGEKIYDLNAFIDKCIAEGRSPSVVPTKAGLAAIGPEIHTLAKDKDGNELPWLFYWRFVLGHARGGTLMCRINCYVDQVCGMARWDARQLDDAIHFHNTPAGGDYGL
jgi:hypothetical protein